jgi:excisionase family DNA binding protein
VKTATVGEGFAVSGGSPPTTPSYYLTVKEAAEFSSLSVRTIRAMLARDSVNALPCRRVGRKILIARHELIQYLDAYRVSGRPGVIATLKEIGL